MAFINPGGTGVIAFAEYSDVTSADTRLFESNEVLADETLVEDLTEKATSRILQLIRNTEWWKRYFLTLATESERLSAQTLSGYIDAPLPNANLIERRQADFTDLCVYFTLYEYLLPKVADFGNPDSAEVKKLGYYRTKFEELFRELINDGSWYDFNNNGSVTTTEKLPTRTNLARVR